MLDRLDQSGFLEANGGTIYLVNALYDDPVVRVAGRLDRRRGSECQLEGRPLGYEKRIVGEPLTRPFAQQRRVKFDASLEIGGCQAQDAFSRPNLLSKNGVHNAGEPVDGAGREPIVDPRAATLAVDQFRLSQDAQVV